MIYSRVVALKSTSELLLTFLGLNCVRLQFCRSDTIENVLCESLFPTEFSIKDKVKHWVRVFSVFDKVEVKALEKILEQKQRYVVLDWLGPWL